MKVSSYFSREGVVESSDRVGGGRSFMLGFAFGWRRIPGVAGVVRKNGERPASPRAARHRSFRVLPYELVRAVGLDLEDVELRVQRVVGLRRELEAPAEDPVLDLHLLDVPDDVAPLLERSVAGGARQLDRVHE